MGNIALPVYAEPAEVTDSVVYDEGMYESSENITYDSLSDEEDDNDISVTDSDDETQIETTYETSEETSTESVEEVTSDILTSEEEIALAADDTSAVFNLTDNGTCISSLTEAGKKLAIIDIPEGIEKIGYQAFCENKVVEEVILPDSLREIGGEAFENATKLKKINLQNVEEIGTEAFFGCESLREADISKVKMMSRGIFEGCTSLESVDFSGAERLNYNAFKDCSSLKTISEFNSKVMTIQPYMFQNSGLTEVNLPYTIKRIGAYAFDGCSKLKDIYVYRNADADENSCDVSQKYWPSGKGVTVHCVKGSNGEKFANYLNNTIAYMALTPVENMTVFRQDGGDANNLALKIGGYGKLFIIDMGPQYCNQPVNYDITNKNVARVSLMNDDEADAYGRYNFWVGPCGAGNAKVTVKCGTLTHTINVSVGIQATSIVVASTDSRYGGDGTEGIKILPGEEVKLVTRVEPAEATQAVTFESLDTDVATVTVDGSIKAVSNGITSIRVKTTDESNLFRDIKVFVPYVIDINDASDIHCKKGDVDWLDFEKIGNDYKHPGIVWRYTPKRSQSEEIKFKMQGALGKSGWMAICYGDGTEAANCSSAKERYEDTIGWYHASAYRKEINNVTISVRPEPFAIYYSPGDPGNSEGFWVSSFREYGKTYRISYVCDDFGAPGNNPNVYESGDVIILDSPGRENYKFMGWYLGTDKLPVNEDGKSVLDTNSITGDIILKATWKGTLDIPAAKLSYVDKEGKTVVLVSSDSPIIIEKGTRVELTKERWGCDIFYTTDGREPDKNSNIYRGSIAIDKDTVIKAIVFMPGQEPSSVATWNLKAEEAADYLGDVRIEDVEVQFDGDIDRIPQGLWVAGYEVTTPYTGSNITFSDIRVYDYKTLLSPATDYKITYKNNKKAYTYSQSDEGFVDKNAPQFIITGKGNYATAKTVFFKIMPRDISLENAGNMTCVSDIVLATNGRGQKPVPTVKWNGIALKAKTEFTYEYRDSDNNIIDSISEAGDYKLVVTGYGNYTGTKEAQIKLVDTKATGITLVSKLTVSALPAQEYKAGGYSVDDIHAIFANPDNRISVKNGKNPLAIADNENDSNGQYYIKDVINSDKPGNATVVIAATKDSNYVGSKEVKLTIKGMAISKAKLYFIEGDDLLTKLTVPYTGDAIKPEVQLSYPVSRTESQILSPLTDYDVVYTGNVAAGAKATVVITGKGAYTGSFKKTFTIKPYDITGVESPKVSVRFTDAENLNDYHYVKSAVQPQLEVAYSYTDNDGKPQEHILTKGTDYTVAYKNNKKVGYEYSTDNKGNSIAPTATITLKGSYKGKIVTTFNIEPCYMEEISVVAADKVAAAKANAWKSAIALVDKNGQKLVANKDYDAKNIRYMYANDTVVSLVRGGSAIREAGETVDANDVPPVGTYIQVEVSAGASTNYYGYTRGVYRIIGGEYDLSKATVKIINPETNSAKYYYTGSGICPNKEDIHVYVKRGSNQVEVDSSCFVVESYKNNIKKGNASLVIKGIGEYGGTKSATYTILSKSVLTSWFE